MTGPLWGHLNHKKRSENAYWILTGLLYPAFLGGLIYEATVVHPIPLERITTAESVLLILLFVLYAFDYAYTVDDESRQNYRWWHFGGDLLIIFLMYRAMHSAQESDAISVCAYLFWTRAIALLWEMITNFAQTADRRARVIEGVSDGIPALLYWSWLLFNVQDDCATETALKVLVFFVVVDAVLYFIHPMVLAAAKSSEKKMVGC